MDGKYYNCDSGLGGWKEDEEERVKMRREYMDQVTPRICIYYDDSNMWRKKFLPFLKIEAKNVDNRWNGRSWNGNIYRARERKINGDFFFLFFFIILILVIVFIIIYLIVVQIRKWIIEKRRNWGSKFRLEKTKRKEFEEVLQWYLEREREREEEQ